MTPARTPVCVERGDRRTFACALAWPGWCRSGRDEAAALAGLGASASRFGQLVTRADLTFPDPETLAFEVVERLAGSTTTDYGAPGAIAASEREAAAPDFVARAIAILDAAWDAFDAVAASAPPTLRKGPRGGGRDRDAIVTHVATAEVAYGRKLGLTLSEARADERDATLARRTAICDAFRHPPVNSPTTWPIVYAARRVTWHIVEHLWEIEDRSQADP